MRVKGHLVRFLLVPVGLALWQLVLMARLCDLHLGNHSRLSRDWERVLKARRGAIYDRNGEGNPLAVSVPGRKVFLDPATLNPAHDRALIVSRLAALLDCDADAAMVNLKRTDSRYIQLGVSFDESAMELVTNKTVFSGVGIEDIVVRRYPLGRRMAHVIGFVNYGHVGSAGLEQRYENYLRGTDGYILGEVDANRQEIRSRRQRFISPIDGSSLYLTLDQNIQYVTEKALADAMVRHRATAVWAIVQRVRTGEILAMAAVPDFDPSRYNEFSCDLWRNPSLGVVYEPGSTMKAMIVSAALNEELVTPDTRIDVGPGSWFYGGRVLRDHVQGTVDVATVIKKSSNIGAAKIALMLGNRRMECYLRAFGFGAVTGIDLPGEEQGILMPASKWNVLSPTRMAIGQGVAVTALQLLGAYCAIANDGQLMRPYIVSRIVSANGEVLVRNDPRVVARPIRPAVAATMRRLLTGVTEEGGTARRAEIPGYSVAGKTGTAQIPLHGGYSDTDFWASFVGFVPASNPEFGMVVVVERPQPLHTGGVVAAPVFAEIAGVVAQYLELPVDLPETDANEEAGGNRLASR
ncbi:MAG: penicillin-binding protein 2 [Kiritimatiellae bacterium]|nr:penicillin-binding protein 2 [Kiritimatiellia bacterium]